MARYKYSTSQIIKDWRKARYSNNYALTLSEKHNVPKSVIYNVVHQHCRKKRQADLAYRQKAAKSLITGTVPTKARKSSKVKVKTVYTSNLGIQNHVIYAGANFENIF